MYFDRSVVNKSCSYNGPYV